MAYTKKTNNVSNNTPKEEIKETVKETESKKEERVFAPEDTIPCRSLISGGLYIEGSRSHILYMLICIFPFKLICCFTFTFATTSYIPCNSIVIFFTYI